MNAMEIEKAKYAAKTLDELSESGKDVFSAMRGTTRAAATAKKLWLEGNKSRLIKIGVACVVFPDPTPVGPVLGAGFIAAGLVQRQIQKRALYIGDIKKTFQSTLREVQLTTQTMK